MSIRRRLRHAIVALTLMLAIAIVVTIVLLTKGAPGSPPPNANASTSTYSGATTVQRRNLVQTDTESGTLSYAGTHTVYNRLGGTITWLPVVGQLIRPGYVLYRVDNKPVLLLDGPTPAYRDLKSSDSAGPDILELNAELVELGFNPDGIVVDDEWQAATTAGVDALQLRWDETETGKLTLGQVVFLPGAQLISAVSATVGSTGGGGGGGGSPAALHPAAPRAQFVDLPLMTTGTTTAPATGTTTAPATGTTTTPATTTGTTTTPATTTTTTPATTTGTTTTPATNTGTTKTRPTGTGTTTTPPYTVPTTTTPTTTGTTTTPPRRHHAPSGTRTTPRTATTPPTRTTPTSTTPTSTTPAAHPGAGGPAAGSTERQQLAALIALLKAETAQLAHDRSTPPAGTSPQSTTPRSTSTTPTTSTTPAHSSSPGSGSPSSSSGGGGSATAILQTTSDHLIVTVDLPASSQSEAKVGERVTIDMPAGNTVTGRISGVSSVAQASSSGSGSGGGGGGGGSTATVPVTIALTQPVSGAGLDQAPVSVNFVQAKATHVLSVPVTALVATGGGNYALLEAAAPHRLVPVTTGLFAAGYVQVSGSGMFPGLQVTDSQG